MKNTIYKQLLIILFITGIVISIGCESSNKDHHEHGHHDHNEEHHDDHEVSITQQQATRMGLVIGTIKNMPLSKVIETNGELELAPQNIADVHVLVGGIVNNIKVIEGSRVTKGSILATVSHPDIIKLQEELISQNAQLSYSENEYHRQEKLYVEKVGSGKEYQKIKSEYEGLKALTDALKAKLDIIGIDPDAVIKGEITNKIYVRSPLNGKVSLVKTNIGEYVSTNERLFQIVDNSHIHAAFRIYEQDILQIKEGQKIVISSPSFPKKTFNATVYAISPAFEDNPKNVHIHADLETNNNQFISGMYISGKIMIDDSVRSVVPRTAVISQEDKTYIFVQQNNIETKHKTVETTHKNTHNEHHDNHSNEKISFKKVSVTTGIEEGDWIEIISNKLPTDSKIALDGAYYLIAEMGKGETAHEH